jgi:flavin reductase (DIM6/NTAB) family NADH-FMN oxidoreductase RutF
VEIDFSKIEPRDRYRILVGAIVPRPLALVSTTGVDGRHNAAPFSFFNAVSDDPPAVALGINSSAPTVKDTARNIRNTGVFVINLVDEALAERMNLCSAELPAEQDEFTFAGLTPVAGTQVAAVRVLEAPISLECRRLVNVEIGLGRNVVIGEVVHAHVRDDLIEPGRLSVDGARAGLVARMHGLGWYARTTDLFDMPRPDPQTIRSRIQRIFGGAPPPC